MTSLQYYSYVNARDTSYWWYSSVHKMYSANVDTVMFRISPAAADNVVTCRTSEANNVFAFAECDHGERLLPCR